MKTKVETLVQDRDKLIKVYAAQTHKVDSITNNCPGNIRVYCQSPSSLGLQIRTEGPIHRNRSGVSFQCYSHASLGIEAAVELRDWLSQWILEKSIYKKGV